MEQTLSVHLGGLGGWPDGLVVVSRHLGGRSRSSAEVLPAAFGGHLYECGLLPSILSSKCGGGGGGSGGSRVGKVVLPNQGDDDGAIAQNYILSSPQPALAYLSLGMQTTCPPSWHRQWKAEAGSGETDGWMESCHRGQITKSFVTGLQRSSRRL